MDDMSNLFTRIANFNEPLDGWDVSRLTVMAAMFRGALSFNQPVSSWDVNNALDMAGKFVDH